MEKQYTLKVYPKEYGKEIYRVLTLCGKESLDCLCSLILEEFDFTDEHLYEFCMDCRMYSEYSYQSDSEDPSRPSTRVRLDQIGLVEKQKFLLHYDFGDDREFIITVQKIDLAEKYSKPKTIKSKGQIEQYSEWDDEEE